jgi:hypothetical protein
MQPVGVMSQPRHNLNSWDLLRSTVFFYIIFDIPVCLREPEQIQCRFVVYYNGQTESF